MRRQKPSNLKDLSSHCCSSQPGCGADWSNISSAGPSRVDLLAEISLDACVFAANHVAADLALGATLHLETADGIIAEGVGIGAVADPIVIFIAAKTDARATVPINHVVTKSVATAPRVETCRFLVSLSRTAIVLDDVSGGALLDVDALVATGVESVVMNPVCVGAVDRCVRHATLSKLLRRGSDIDTFAVLAAILVDEVIDAAIFNGRTGNLVALSLITQPDALAARIPQAHADDAQSGYSIAGAVADRIYELVAIAVLALFKRVLPVNGEAMQLDIIVVDLGDPVRACARNDCIAWAPDDDWSSGLPVSDSSEIL